MDERESKLPKWARDELSGLRRQIEELYRMQAIARGAATSQGATGKVMADDLGRPGFPLHDRASVTFHLRDGSVTCMLRENGTVLDLNSRGTLLIMPRAANAVQVKTES